MAEWGSLSGVLVDKSKGLTALAAQILQGYTALVNGTVVTGTYAPTLQTQIKTGLVLTGTSATISGFSFKPLVAVLMRTTSADNYVGRITMVYGSAQGSWFVGSFANDSTKTCSFSSSSNSVTFSGMGGSGGQWALSGTYQCVGIGLA